MKLFGLCFLIFVVLNETSAWRTFWRGRRFDGNVGHPTDFQGSLRNAGDEDLWFEQKLDHFEPMNDKTWKQVCIFRLFRRQI